MNKFDAYQTMVNFGTKPLDESDRIYKCSNTRVAKELLTKPVYGRVAPHICSGFNRGFYFQPVLLEYSFGDDLQKVAHEPSIISLEGLKGEKPLTKNGGAITLPFYPCYILVNRALFAPQRQREDENTWLNVMTERRRAIAHELLYAQQYSEFYDLESDTLTKQIAAPIASEEDVFLCPTDVIEKHLDLLEVEHGEKYLTAGNFVDGNPKYLQTYYRLWLMNHAVSENICKKQTISYLETGLRHHVHENAQTLIGQISGITKNNKPSSTDFKDCLHNNHPHSPPLTELCEQYEQKFQVNKKTVVHAVGHMLDSHNGTRKNKKS